MVKNYLKIALRTIEEYKGFSIVMLLFVFITNNKILFGQENYELKLEPYVFVSNNGDTVDAELGKFYVPENRKTNSRKRIQLAFIRFKSTNPNPGSPIVYLAGGPGGSGTGTAKYDRFELFMAMREIGDVIAFDQRGTGMSERLPGAKEGYSLPYDEVTTSENTFEAIKTYTQSMAKYWKEQGVDLSAYNTEESADDLEDLRKVLGAEKISLWSISYGTHLAIATIKRHREILDRVIMAGLEGPDHTDKLPSQHQLILERIDALIKADPVASKIYPDFLGMLDTLLNRLEKQPITVNFSFPGTDQNIPYTFSKFDLQLFTTIRLSGPSNFKILPQFYKALLDSHISILPSIVKNLHYGSFGAMNAAMDAASGISNKRLQQIENEKKTCLLEDISSSRGIAIREGLSVPDLGDEFRKNIETDIPALFISGTLDGSTPVSNAKEIIQGFSNGVHLIIEGAGHSNPLFLSSPKIKDIMLDFMKSKNISNQTITLPPVKFPVKKIVEVDNSILEEYVGKYEWAPDDYGSIIKKDKVLLYQEGGFICVFYPESNNSFFRIDANWHLSFIQNEQGEIIKMLIKTSRGKSLAKKVK